MAFPVTIDLAENGGAQRFRTVEEMRAFVDREWNAWSWLGAAANQAQNQAGRLPALVNMWNTFQAELAAIRQAMDTGEVGAAESRFLSYFTSPTSLPTSISSRGSLVRMAVEQISPRGGLGALATLSGQRFDGDDPDQLRGAFLAHEFLQGTGKAARQSVQDGMSTLVQKLSAQQIRAEDKADALDGRVDQIERRRKHQFGRLLQSADRARKKFAGELDANLQRFQEVSDAKLDELQTEVRAALSSIANTEKTYSEHMGLKAPVTYWREKAVAHRDKARLTGGVGLVFAVAMIALGLTQGVDWVLRLVKTVFDTTHQWQATYAVLGIALFVLTVVFWIGRLISRTYVSESHLAIDAEERAVMVETYLALTQENKIDTSERILVLGSLFRESSDGLVKDDGAPDFAGLAGVLSKAGVGGASGK